MSSAMRQMTGQQRTACPTTPCRGASVFVAVSLALTTLATAAPRIAIPDGLKQSATACLAEALQLCPGALAAKDHGVSCILGKRHLLSRPCQGIYDQALRLLHGQDIHIDLRPRKPR